MTACPSCASDCPEGARFCPSCGTALAAPPSHAVERKVVTTMFCDLVDFTGLCEAADAEDVERLLRAFYALARSAIEIYGGLVEKFVGDAVVGIFGVPAAHEDDAERAVLTALRLRERLCELPQIAGRTAQVRIGINTGSALVRLDVQPSSGAGVLVGDAVNTAARLQQLAPPMGIVVGETTQALSARTIDYEKVGPTALKGKRSAVKCWLVRGRIARLGVDLRQQFAAPLVGREVELGILQGLLKKVRASGQPQFALLVGEPGIGKSRLLFELLRYIDNRPAIVHWRQGRCPPYGDGLAFWALGEIVREQLGVREGDEVAVVEAKLAHALAGTEEREWLAARLRPLLGLESPGAGREENFAAWQRFLELIAGDAPTVVLFEDLHWASEGTLAFLRHLTENLSGVPLLAVGTTRPELLRSQPDLAARLAEMAASQRGTLLDLGPLSESESEELVSRVGSSIGEGRASRRAIVGRAAGNPLFVEQLVSHLERQLSRDTQLTADDVIKELVAEALPVSLQSLIAARLDELPPEHRTLLGDAAVVGQVFWTGAVAALDHGDRMGAEAALHDLATRDLVRHERDSSLAGESEFAFCHGLIRDVAYAQLTRGDRAAKHAAVARWLEKTAGERLIEVAEILAHHYTTALELAQAAHNETLATELSKPGIRALELAGDRALPLDAKAAERHYGQAATLLKERHTPEPRLLVKWSDALWESGREQQAIDTLDAAIRGMEGSDRHAEVALARTRKVLRLWDMDSHQWPRLPRIAADLLRHGDDSPELVRLLQDWAYICFYRDDRETGMAAVSRAIDIAARLGLPTPVLALGLRGIARCEEDDPAGFDDLRTALFEAHAQGVEHPANRIASNLADQMVSTQGPAAAARIRREALERAHRRRDDASVARLTAGLVEDLVWSGEWEESEALVETLEPELAQRTLDSLGDVRACVALASLLRGRLDEAERMATWAETFSRGTRFESRCASLMTLALVRAAQGDGEAALDLLRACPQLPGSGRRLHHYTLRLPQACRVAVETGDEELACRLAAGLGTRPLDACTRTSIDAIIADSHGERTAADLYAASARGWDRMTVPWAQGWALLRRAHCLSRSARVDQAVTDLTAACNIFTSLGAMPALAESQALLARIQEAGA